MTYNELKHTISNTHTVKLLRAKNAPLIISFLYQEFKVNNRIAILSYDLINHLADYIELLEDNEVIDIDSTDPLTMARKYVDQWCSEETRYLTRYPDETGEPLHELTPHTEKAFQWMQSLQQREFIGTESRFRDIYRRLRELIDNTSEDPKKKIKELEKKRKAITRQINEIKATGVVETYNDTQIKERFYEISKTARELTSDFKQVEQNFKNITLNIYKKQTQSDVDKGQILGYTLDATDELKNSDQGKSFYAFWQFLIADNKQDELINMIEYTYSLLRQRNIDYADNFLKKIKVYLHNAGQKVIDSNHLLADKLSRILVERDMLERKQAQEIINEIKSLAVEKIGQFHGKRQFISIEGLPNIALPMDRRLGKPRQKATFKNQPTEIGSQKYEQADLGVLFDQFEMDKQQLQQNIDQLLEQKAQVTLAEVVQLYPIKKGLEEVITYFAIASKSQKHFVNQEIIENLTWRDELNERKINLPQIIYVR